MDLTRLTSAEESLAAARWYTARYWASISESVSRGVAPNLASDSAGTSQNQRLPLRLPDCALSHVLHVMLVGRGENTHLMPQAWIRPHT